jgi:uncharacterized protein
VDTTFELYGEHFRWNAEKAALNISNHGVMFERAAEVFFDPELIVVDAERNEEARYAVVGFDHSAHLLYVVHVEREDEGAIRLISARAATASERKKYGHS